MNACASTSSFMVRLGTGNATLASVSTLDNAGHRVSSWDAAPDQVQVRAIEGEQVTVFESWKPTRAGFCHNSTRSLLRCIVHMNGAAECSRWRCRKRLTTQQEKARTVRR